MRPWLLLAAVLLPGAAAAGHDVSLGVTALRWPMHSPAPGWEELLVAPKDGSGPASSNLMRSDHAPFWMAGHSALFLTDTANFRNPHNHRDTDVPSTLDLDFLTDVTRLSAAGLSLWAEGLLP